MMENQKERFTPEPWETESMVKGGKIALKMKFKDYKK